MFTESPFSGHCATSMGEVLLIIAGSFLLGLLLGYLIWGWVKSKLNEQEQKIIELNRTLTTLTDDNQALKKSRSEYKEEIASLQTTANLKSSQYTSAMSRIRELESVPTPTIDPNLEANLKAMSATLDAKEKEIKSANEAIAKKQSGLDELSQNLDAMQKSLTDKEAAYMVKETSLTSRHEELDAKAAILNDKEAMIKQRAVDLEKKAVIIAEAATAPVIPLSAASTVQNRKPGRPKKVATDIEEEKPKRRPGRPRKESKLAVEDKPKRRPGRPKKVITEAVEEKPKRRPGRPRKSESAKVEEPKRRRGRPRKNADTSAAVSTVKRKPGRPKKVKTEEQTVAKKGPGRPRKIAKKEEVKTKRRRGRPKKVATTAAVAPTTPKRKSGRPKKSTTVAKTTIKSSGRGRPKGSKNKPKAGQVLMGVASEIFGKRIKQDDLKLIEGVGPKIAKLFRANDLDTWEKVATASQATLKSTIEKIGPRHHIHDPATWPRQARMAHRGEWKKLKVYQDSLNRGRKE